MQIQRICKLLNTTQMHYVRNGSRFDSPTNIISPWKVIPQKLYLHKFYNYLSVDDIVYKIYRQLHLSPKALIQVIYQDMRLT